MTAMARMDGYIRLAFTDIRGNQVSVALSEEQFDKLREQMNEFQGDRPGTSYFQAYLTMAKVLVLDGFGDTRYEDILGDITRGRKDFKSRSAAADRKLAQAGFRRTGKWEKFSGGRFTAKVEGPASRDPAGP